MNGVLRTWSYITLNLRSFRLELALLVGASGLVFIAMFAAAAQLEGFGVTSTCIGQWFIDSSPSSACGTRVPDWAMVNDQIGRNALVAGSVLTIATGLVLGVIMVGRELENGTAEFTWALATSRRRWLLQRVLFGFGVVVVLSAALALASSLLEDQRTAHGLWVAEYPDADLVGWPVLARALAAFSVGLLLGALIGRTLPAFMAGALMVVVVVNGLGVGQALFAPPPPGGGGTAALGLYLQSDALDVIFVDHDGQLLLKGDVLASVPAGEDPVGWLTTRYLPIPIGISARRSDEWQLVLTGAYAVVGLISFGLALLVADRRRPY